MKTHVQMLQEMGVSSQDAAQYIGALETLLPKYGIAAKPLRLAHFFAQVLHESGLMRFDTENLNYSADGLLKVFPRYFKTRAVAVQYERKPEKIASKVYANRMGNGAESTGDGFKYRGRGLIQLTGRENYKAFATWVNDRSVMDHPDLVASHYAVHSAVYYWDKNKLNAIADKDDILRLTKAINGGTNGLAHRRELFNKARGLIAMLSIGG